MPRNVRNWWIDARIDGRTSKLEGGPSSKEGGFTLNIKQRDDGVIVQPLRVEGLARTDGSLLLRVYVNGKLTEYETRR